MFGIGYQEMFIILVVAMVIFGPSRLPELAGQVGRWVRDFRRMSSDLTGEFEKTFAEVDEVKKSFKREMQSIQEEVDGVGKSARGDLKKSAKGTASGKKATGGALKAGTGTGATGASAAKSPAKQPAGKTATASAAAGNGARPKMPALESRKRAGNTAVPAASLTVATKSDPLVDVSFFDPDMRFMVSANGSAVPDNGATILAVDDALVRVRQRRATAAYGRRNSG